MIFIKKASILLDIRPRRCLRGNPLILHDPTPLRIINLVGWDNKLIYGKNIFLGINPFKKKIIIKCMYFCLNRVEFLMIFIDLLLNTQPRQQDLKDHSLVIH